MTPDSSYDREPSATGLVADLIAGISRLVRGELALAKAEAKRSVNDAIGAIIAAVVAVVLVIISLNLLAAAAVAGLVALGLPPVWATIIVGAVLLVIAVGLVLYAKAKLSPDNLAPKRSVANLRRDAETFKSMVSQGATADIHS